MADTVHDALAQAQAHIAVPKGRNNEFGGYKYRKAEDIIGAFRACGIEGATLVLTDRLEEIGGQIFVIASARLSFKGDSITAEGGAMHALQKKGMDASQITGSASSYARKYALQGLFALDDGDSDPDARDNRKENGNDPAQIAIDSLKGADTIDALAAIWSDLPRNIQHNDRVISAKDDRKKALQPKEMAQ